MGERLRECVGERLRECVDERLREEAELCSVALGTHWMEGDLNTETG